MARGKATITVNKAAHTRLVNKAERLTNELATEKAKSVNGDARAKSKAEKVNDAITAKLEGRFESFKSPEQRVKRLVEELDYFTETTETMTQERNDALAETARLRQTIANMAILAHAPKE